jgi:hypothetical protein
VFRLDPRAQLRGRGVVSIRRAPLQLRFEMGGNRCAGEHVDCAPAAFARIFCEHTRRSGLFAGRALLNERFDHRVLLDANLARPPQ